MKKDKQSLSPEARAIIRAQLTRRTLFAGVGAVSAAGLLAACGTGSSTGAEAVIDVSDSEKIVRWANWPLYLDFDEDTKVYPTLAAFEQKSGIKATYEEAIDDNNTFYGRFKDNFPSDLILVMTLLRQQIGWQLDLLSRDTLKS